MIFFKKNKNIPIFSFQVGKEMLCPRQNGEGGSGNGGEEGGFNLLMELLRGDL